MAIPALPVFDDEEPENITPVTICQLGRLALFVATVVGARRVRESLWERELSAVSALWSASPRQVLRSSLLINACLVVDILFAVTVGLRMSSALFGQPLPNLFGQNSWFLGGLFLMAQILPLFLRMAPQDRLKLRFNLRAGPRSIPTDSIRFAAFLDLMALLCAFPVISTLTYGGILEVTAEIPTSSFLLMISVSTIAVMLPVAHNVPVSQTPLALTSKPTRKERIEMLLKKESDVNVLDLRVKNYDKEEDELTEVPPVVSQLHNVMESAADKDAHFSDSDERPCLTINSEGCSPLLINRLQQMEHTYHGRKATLRSQRRNSNQMGDA
ncbi:hypothetical protein RvY_05003 [Ramazzottius varieornatus]|uniref:Uncharacterized protein n=1 Tax=Ramazzottius varieornatus TaxID=947166 RepID=A0A1D1UU65_RAMVA|nr:hypothetical protein RvY_05003 [Ramazzottius varieornatus]